MDYLTECTKYFAPMDEIAEALYNQEGVNGLSYIELVTLVQMNDDLITDMISCGYGYAVENI